MRAAAFDPLIEMGPYDSPINLHPNDPATLRGKILSSRAGKLLGAFLPDDAVARIGLKYLKARKAPGRLFSFLLRKRG